MDDNAIHEWLIKCFGPIQGEMAWQQISQLPEEIREQLMSQDPSRLPNPSEVQQMMAAFSAGGLNTMGDMQRTVEEGRSTSSSPSRLPCSRPTPPVPRPACPPWMARRLAAR